VAPITPQDLTAEVLDGPVPVVRVRGELDLSTAARLCRAIQAAAVGASLRRRITIDLTELEFCDSTGLRALMHAVREIEVLGGRASVIVTPGSALDRLLDMTGSREFLRVRDRLAVDD
jgi:anti-sigma B factor antagonist